MCVPLFPYFSLLLLYISFFNLIHFFMIPIFYAASPVLSAERPTEICTGINKQCT